MGYFTNVLRKYYPAIVFFLLTTTIIGCFFLYGITAPGSFGNSFLVVGDSRSGDSIYQEIVSTITSSFSYAGCLIHMGDMIEKPGDQVRWKNFLNLIAPISQVMPWYAVVGNHDVNSISSQQIYQNVMNSPSDQLYYSFDLMNSHFIILDTEIPGQKGGIVGEQLDWLRQDLQRIAASPPRYLFVFTHRPLFPQGHHRGHDLINAVELHQLFVQYGVDAVFAGHEHQYYLYQKDTIPYVITGGGGAPTHDDGMGESYHHFLRVELLLPETINIHVLDVHGNIIKTEVVATGQ